MAPKKRMGRPPKPPAERRDAQVTVSLTKAELARLRREARGAGVTVSELLMRAWREGEV